MIRTISLAIVFLLASPVAMAQVASQSDVLSYIQQGGLASVVAILIWVLIREYRRSDKLQTELKEANEARFAIQDRTLTTMHQSSTATLESGKTVERMATSLSTLPEMGKSVERMADRFDELSALLKQFMNKNRPTR